MRFLASTLVLLGPVFILLGAIGLLRFPDVLSRANAATKAATLGLGSLLLGGAILEEDGAASVKLIVAAVLIFVTSPVAGHLIGRAAYWAGAPLKIHMSDELAPHAGHRELTGGARRRRPAGRRPASGDGPRR